MLDVLILSSVFVSFCLICFISFWFLNVPFLPPSISLKALSVAFLGFSLDIFLLLILRAVDFPEMLGYVRSVFKDGGSSLQFPGVVPSPCSIQAFFFLASIILSLLNFDSTPGSFPSVCGHASERSPGWSVSRVYRGKKRL